jgi:hypothetical protein
LEKNFRLKKPKPKEGEMKKVKIFVFLFLFLFGVLAVDASAQTRARDTRERVKLEVNGFENDQQALLFISKYAKGKAPDAWNLVRSNPDLVMEVNASVRINYSHVFVDQKAVVSNNQLRAIDQRSNDAINRIPYRYGKDWLRIGTEVARDIVVSRHVDTKYQIERYLVQELIATVEVVVYDPARCVAGRCEILYAAIGINDIVVKTAQEYGYEAIAVLESGDLSSLGLSEGANLGNSYYQLVALSAFMKSERRENQIGY